MPFIIKASYDGKTRRWPQQSDVFPSYQSLSDQIHKVFQNVDNFYLTRVTFSPSTNEQQTPNPAQFVLIATAVHSADEWANTAAAPFLGVSYPTGMLKFIVNDKLPHKEAPIRGGPWANAMDVDVEPRFSIPPLPRMPRGFVPIPPPIPPVPSLPSFAPQPMSGPAPFIPFIPPPPPPGLMTQPPPRPVPAPSLRSVPSNLSATSAGAASSFTVGASSSTCCSVTSAKTEVRGMMDSFLKEFQKTVADNFGAEHAGEAMDTSSPIVPDRTPLAPNRPLSPIGNIPGAFNAPNSPAEPVVHNNVICDHCEKTVKGIRYKCNDCPDFDICESCMGENNNGAVIHNVQLEKNHTFKAIPKPVSSSPSTTPPPTHNASCDVCRKTIVGSRHKCLDCPDYDLCDKCVASHRDKHPAEHEFYEFKEPGRIVIHNVTRPFPRHSRGGHHHPFGHHHHAGRGRPFGGRGGFAGRPASDRPHEESTRGAPDVTVPPVGGRMPLVAHNATCDLCDSKIHGNRYKCSMCPDYDVCESCFSIVVEQHPKHAFVRIRDPKDVMVRSHHYANRTVHHARCDSCGKQIVGARFKCTHRDCPDFDLCENCEALPIEAHPSSHALIKLRHPISFYDGLTGVLEYAKATKEKQAEMMDAARTGVASPQPSVSIWQPTVIRHVTEPGEPMPYIPPTCFVPPTRLRAPSPQPPTTVPKMIRVELNYVPATPDPVLVSPQQLPTPVIVSPHMPTPLVIPAEKVEQALPSASNPWVAEPIVLEGEGEMVQMPLRPTPLPIGLPVPEGSLVELTRAMSIKTGSASPSIINTPSTVKSILEEEEEAFVAALADPEEKMEVSVPPSMDDSASPFNDAHAVEVRRVDDDAVSVVSAAPSVISVAPSVASVAPSVAPSVVSRAPSVASVPPSVAPSVISLASSHSSIKSAPRPSATFVADITIPDGHILPPGAFFVKTWQMLNDGEVPWPAGTRLAFTGGERFGTNSAEHLLIAGLTPPGEMTELRVEFRAPEEAGRYISNWRLQDEEGRLFGHRIWCDIEVVEPAEAPRNRAVEGVRELNSKSSHSSLSSSSIMIMPASVLSEEAVAAASAAAVASPIQAPLPTPTLSSFDGDASDIGSHVSSVADDDVFSVADSDFQWEEASRPQSPDQFVMVYETSNDGSDSD